MKIIILSLYFKIHEDLSIKNLDKPILICNEEYRFITAEQMREINIIPKAILLEPVGRDGPAVTIAALRALENGENPLLLALSSDHVITNQKNLINALKQEKYANQGRLVTFGVNPYTRNWIWIY